MIAKEIPLAILADLNPETDENELPPNEDNLLSELISNEILRLDTQTYDILRHRHIKRQTGYIQPIGSWVGKEIFELEVFFDEEEFGLVNFPDQTNRATIFRYLFERKGEWVRVEELANLIGTTERNIIRTIRDLSKSISEHTEGENPIQIQKHETKKFKRMVAYRLQPTKKLIEAITKNKGNDEN